MSLNIFRDALPDFNYQQSEDWQELPYNVYIKDILLRISATVSISGGASDGTVLDDGLERLIRNLRVSWDGENLVDTTGRMLSALTRRAIEQDQVATQISGAGTGVSSEALETHLLIPFAKPWLADPFDSVLPPLDVQQQLRLYIDWETAAAGSGSSDPGTGALISGGDRDVTFDSGPLIEATVRYAVSGKKPLYVPVYREINWESVSAATDPLTARIVNRNRFESILIQSVYGTDFQLQDAIDHVTVRAGGQRYYDRIPLAQVRQEEESFFSAPTDDTGYLFLPFADGGKLGNTVNPRTLDNLRVELDAAAPTSGDLRVKALMGELMTIPGATQVQG